MKKTNIKWRLGILPTPSELNELVSSDLITKEEARNMLLTIEEVEDRDKKSLEEEIKFLRTLVESITKNNTKTIIETIKYIEKPYYNQSWYAPYQVWCGAVNIPLTSSITLCGAATSSLNATGGTMNSTGNNSFSKINTF